MRILICIKQILNKEYLKNNAGNTVLNPADRFALEEVLMLKQKVGASSTAACMGPHQAEAVLKEAIALGIDEAVLVCDDVYRGSDTLATAQVLATMVKKIGEFDLIVCGCCSVDGETGQVGPELAEKLGIPHISYVTSIDRVIDDKIECMRMVDEGSEKVRVKLPALLTVMEGINTPRLKTIRGIMKASKSSISIMTNDELKIPTELCGEQGSATKVYKSERVVHQHKTIFIQESEKNIAELLHKIL